MVLVFVTLAGFAVDELGNDVDFTVRVVVVTLKDRDLVLISDRAVGLTVALGVEFAQVNLAGFVVLTPRIEFAVVIAVALGSDGFAPFVEDEFVVGAVSVGVGVALGEFFVLVVQQTDRDALVLGCGCGERIGRDEQGGKQQCVEPVQSHEAGSVSENACLLRVVESH